MLGLSRWTEKGGSYRTIQRFYNTVIPWGTIQWLFFKAHLYRSDTEYLLVGDESVVTKAGKTTHGLDRFFSSIFGRPIPGLAFLAFSLVSIKERKSYPLLVEQVVRSEEEKARIQKEKAAKAARKRTGSKKKKRQQELEVHDQWLSTAVSRVRPPIESLFNWIEEKTGIQSAAKVRSYKGLLVHVFGRLAAALFIMAFSS